MGKSKTASRENRWDRQGDGGLLTGARAPW